MSWKLNLFAWLYPINEIIDHYYILTGLFQRMRGTRSKIFNETWSTTEFVWGKSPLLKFDLF